MNEQWRSCADQGDPIKGMILKVDTLPNGETRVLVKQNFFKNVEALHANLSKDTILIGPDNAKLRPLHLKVGSEVLLYGVSAIAMSEPPQVWPTRIKVTKLPGAK